MKEALHHGRASVFAILDVAHVEVFGEVFKPDHCVAEDDADAERRGQ